MRGRLTFRMGSERSVSGSSRWQTSRQAAWLLFALPSMAAHAWAEDVVYVAGERSGDAEIKIVGEISDYTGRQITVRQPPGVVRNYPGTRVVRVESDWTASQKQAEAAFARGDYRAAAERYTVALREETRVWARRLILVQLVWCHRYLGEVETAAERFLLLVASDPTTNALDAMPVAWFASESVSAARANSWLRQSDSPLANLIGASHLLATDARPAALAGLRELSRHEDPRIAAIATGQLWRAAAFQALPEDVDRWAEMAAKMPVELQAGPYYVLGTALARQERYEAAALALLRPPLLYPRQRDLAAESLVAAAAALADSNRTAQAARLYREVLAGYPGTKAHATATARLPRLNGAP